MYCKHTSAHLSFATSTPSTSSANSATSGTSVHAVNSANSVKSVNLPGWVGVSRCPGVQVSKCPSIEVSRYPHRSCPLLRECFAALQLFVELPSGGILEYEVHPVLHPSKNPESHSHVTAGQPPVVSIMTNKYGNPWSNPPSCKPKQKKKKKQ